MSYHRHNLKARVYIGRLPGRAQERDVTKFFKSYGRIVDVQLKNGYGFVEFDDPRDADDAVYDMNGKELCGERVTVEHAKGPPRSVVERERGGGRRDDRRRRYRSRSRSRSRSRDRRRDRRRSRSRSPRDRRDRSRSRDRNRRDSPTGKRSRSRSTSARKTSGSAKAYRVEIENLPTGITRQELEDHMSAAGKVIGCEIYESEAKAFIDYEDEACQSKAIETLSEFKDAKMNLSKVSVANGAANGSSHAAEKASRSRSRSASVENGNNGNGASNGNGANRSRSRSRSSHSGSSRSSRSRSASRSRSRSPANGNGKDDDRSSSSSGSDHSDD